MRRLLWFLAYMACAQQAIINMPSADIKPKGNHFFMHETQTKWWGQNPY